MRHVIETFTGVISSRHHIHELVVRDCTKNLEEVIYVPIVFAHVRGSAGRYDSIVRYRSTLLYELDLI
jgi:hypothetical protein